MLFFVVAGGAVTRIEANIYSIGDTWQKSRCQSFPDDWEFCGNVSAQYKQVGNAVPVNLAYEIGREIIKSLKMGE